MWSGFIGLSVQSGMEFKMLQNATICNLRKSLFIKCLSIAVKGANYLFSLYKKTK